MWANYSSVGFWLIFYLNCSAFDHSATASPSSQDFITLPLLGGKAFFPDSENSHRFFFCAANSHCEALTIYLGFTSFLMRARTRTYLLSLSLSLSLLYTHTFILLHLHTHTHAHPHSHLHTHT